MESGSLICCLVWFAGEAETQKAAGTEEEVGRKETMELFPQSAGLGVQDAAAPDATTR